VSEEQATAMAEPETQEGAEESSVPQEAPKAQEASVVRPRTEKDKIRYLNFLDFGDSGVGKTRFAGTVIEAGLKTLYVTLNEDELMTLDQVGIRGYDYQVLTDYEKQLWPLYLALRRNKPGYEAVVFDGLADFQQMAKDYELAGDKGITAEFMQQAMKGNRRMYLQNWGNLLEMTRHFLDPVLKLPLHKLVTCVAEADEDPVTGKPKVYPALQGSLQQLIAAHFSVVAYSFITHIVGETYYCLTTQPHDSVLTKDRTNLNRVLVNPKFKTFLEALDGKKLELTKIQKDIARTLVLRPQASKPKPSE